MRICRIIVGVIVAVLAVVIGLWRRYVVNELHLTPVDLKGKTILLTGATEGIGKESAITFASWGANLIIPVRNAAKGESLKKEILEVAKSGNKVEIFPNVDFADLQTVRDFASKVESRTIDILMNNAGLVVPNVEASKDGIEVMFQVNHLAPFLLTYLLIPALKRAPAPRVVFVGSLAHYGGSIGKDKYSLEKKGMQEYRPLMRYDDSKLMNTMTAVTFSEKFGKDSKITFNSVHPGFVVSNLDGNLPWPLKDIILQVRRIIGRSAKEGAIAQVTVATHPKLEGVTGRFFSDGCINELCYAPCLFCDYENAPGMVPNKEALDKGSRDWLWDVSMKHLKLA